MKTVGLTGTCLANLIFAVQILNIIHRRNKLFFFFLQTGCDSKLFHKKKDKLTLFNSIIVFFQYFYLWVHIYHYVLMHSNDKNFTENYPVIKCILSKKKNGNKMLAVL